MADARTNSRLIFLIYFVNILMGCSSPNQLNYYPAYNQRFADTAKYEDFFKVILLRTLVIQESKIENGVLLKFPTDIEHVQVIDCAWFALRQEIAQSKCNPMDADFKSCYQTFTQYKSFNCTIHEVLNYCGRIHTAVGYFAKDVEDGVIGCRSDNRRDK